ncbi:MAG: NAD-dependent protein deacylase [Dethiobacteria bacterium]|jgi:NAD-dependent deacetylase|nr:NAD-dependent protein deacylase [Bacillota bacterium]NMD33558.1 NAD-dependent protein deacylase [Bacillota bacterium]HOB29158.1 NAD-dependent protein deacylase [Bacillota bacterium]HPZ41770.1 NAD-dependent protein deacylase [Bacillota bacterium]HQD52586.1 NAD-dependent protein deacylase [Bacillota bacterium]
MDYQDQIARAAALIKESTGFYGLTGAGISTESGIPDFRTPGEGIWEKVDPITTSSVEVLQNNPRLFYESAFNRFASITLAEPHEGHYALAKMEQMGFLKGLVTQNIDGLHVKAGSRNIWEVHGHLRSGYCQGCKKRYSFEELVHQVELKRIPPICRNCFDVLRPDVVLFGDPMPPLFYEAEETLRNNCDLMLVAGSSLVVYPVAYLPRLAKRLIIINLMPTEYDHIAEIVIREKCSKALQDLVEKLAAGE